MATNKFTDENTIARCVPMSKLQSVIGGKWKILILWYITFYNCIRKQDVYFEVTLKFYEGEGDAHGYDGSIDTFISCLRGFDLHR